MKRIAVIIWNLLLIGIIATAAMGIVPKIRAQFTSLDRLEPGPLRDWTAAMGAMGIGVMMGCVVVALTFSSPFWGRIARAWRFILGCAYLALLSGAIMVMRIERGYVGSVNPIESVLFLVGIGLFLFPPVVLGRGLLGLASCWITSLLMKKSSSNDIAK